MKHRAWRLHPFGEKRDALTVNWHCLCTSPTSKSWRQERIVRRNRHSQISESCEESIGDDTACENDAVVRYCAARPTSFDLQAHLASEAELSLPSSLLFDSRL